MASDPAATQVITPARVTGLGGPKRADGLLRCGRAASGGALQFRLDPGLHRVEDLSDGL